MDIRWREGWRLKSTISPSLAWRSTISPSWSCSVFYESWGGWCTYTKAQINTTTILTNDVVGTREIIRTIGNQLLQLFNVLTCDSFRPRQGHCNTSRNTNFIQIQSGISRNDWTTTKVDTLAHQVATNTTSFTLVYHSYHLWHTAILCLKVFKFLPFIRCLADSTPDFSLLTRLKSNV